MTQTIDTLITARWVIPVEPEGTVLEQHAVAIQDGRILDILPTKQAYTLYNAKQTHELTDHALIPGLVNTHTHAAMNLFKGFADDMPLMEWLETKIWPAEGQWVNEEFVNDGTELAIAEMISSGTTCFADMYFFPDIVAKTAQQIGMRASVGLIVLDFPTVWAKDANEYIEKAVNLHDALNKAPLISCMFAPHAPYTVSDEPFTRIRTIADELDIPIQCHIHETKAEVENALAQTDKRPLQRLDELGLISPSLMAVHMTQLTDDEINMLAEHGTHVIHCPESNLKLASGFCPTSQLLDAGVNVALGTDSAASNNDLDMLGEMQTTALLAKTVAENASALPAAQALRMATLNGAIALGLANEIGSLSKGKSADITAINLNALNTQPVYDPISQIVYSANSNQVSDVWVAGKQLLKNKQFTTLNIEQILSKANSWQEKIHSNTSS